MQEVIQQILIIRISWRFTETVQKNYYFLTIDTTLPASDPLTFRKIFHSYENGSNWSNQNFRKINQNEAQYDLNRKVAEISALSSGNLDKYEYLLGEDLYHKLITVEKAKFEYSPLGKFFNKWLNEENKKEGLSKKLKNFEIKNEEQLK